MKQCKTCAELLGLDKFYYNTRDKAYFNECKQCCIARKIRGVKVFGSRQWWSRRYYRLKARALKRGLKFSISIDDFIKIRTLPKCSYCANELEIDESTVDRADNRIGYVLGNCIVACRICNVVMKRDVFSESEMKLIGLAIKMRRERIKTSD